jgi:hypothetical protein
VRVAVLVSKTRQDGGLQVRPGRVAARRRIYEWRRLLGLVFIFAGSAALPSCFYRRETGD